MKPEQDLAILLIEDSAEDAGNILKRLRAKPHYQSIHHAALADALRAAAEQPVDLALLDLNLPDSKGLETLDRWLVAYAHIPVVVLTASDDDAIAVKALRRGAQDYLIKGHLEVFPDLLDRSIRYAVERTRSSHQLRLLREQVIQQSRYEALRRLAAGLAHEIKNPLQVILMGLGFLERRIDGDELALSVLKDLTDAVYRADRVLTQLQVFGSQPRLERKPCRVEALLREAIEPLRSRFVTAGIAVEEQLDACPEVPLDANAIVRSLTELMAYGFIALPNGGGLAVRCFTRLLDRIGPSVGNRATDRFRVGEKVIWVELLFDGGVFPEQAPERAFDLFKEMTSPSTGQAANILGLASAQKAIESHGGVLSAHCPNSRQLRLLIHLKLGQPA